MTSPESDDITIILGFCAMSCATMIYMPLIYNIWKTKSVKSISYIFLGVELATDLLWNIYAQRLELQPLFYSTLILFISAFLVGVMKWKYSGLPQNQHHPTQRYNDNNKNVVHVGNEIKSIG
jgi:MtN3 and saliva related transmembrane protein